MSTESKNATAVSAQRPEPLRFALRCWWVVVAAEIIHQITNFIIALLTRGQLRNEIASSQSQELSPKLLDAATIMALAGITGLSLIIVGIIAWLVYTLGRAEKRAPIARRVLGYFAIYFALRAGLLFSMQPQGGIDVAYYAIDGCLQMLIGVLGLLAIYFASRPESVEFIEGKKEQQE
ncbi:hypothetical protein [Corynebacterium pseudopelargi]|uniref:Uncharacterized protein n=1 Tax=Corynebacterium pseudopelargi TaxID=2080757 RepID=A0A3G6J1U0_9CORY|nr:hypothetical protein [Corynebacterium pseudopelargi]AZA10114.1 hypothetical protein CPPEL_10075 [Corynebacterium pseudopelargi]